MSSMKENISVNGNNNQNASTERKHKKKLVKLLVLSGGYQTVKRVLNWKNETKQTKQIFAVRLRKNHFETATVLIAPCQK